jgi:DNA (cytosine-5)-methyltransferase 1
MTSGLGAERNGKRARGRRHPLPKVSGIAPALSIFTGVGGLDIGAHAAGFRTCGAVDIDGEALSYVAETLGAAAVQGSTEELDPREVIRQTGVPRDGSAILVGGPPCTAFSHAGFWLDAKRNGEDVQAGRVRDYAAYLCALRPRAFLFENVPGLLFKNHSAVFDSFCRRVRAEGYRVSYQVLNAADFGVPQARRRLFVVGVRGDRHFEFPSASFSEDRYRSARWAFADLDRTVNPPERDERLTGKYSSLLSLIPAGENYLHLTQRNGTRPAKFRWRSRYWSFLLKLHPDRPSPTIAATRVSNNGPFHWRNRRLRIRELARLQGFPDQYPLASLKAARRHLGNAVPPLLAAQILWQLRVFLGDVRANEIPQWLATATHPDTTAAEVSSALWAAIRG